MYIVTIEQYSIGHKELRLFGVFDDLPEANAAIRSLRQDDIFVFGRGSFDDNLNCVAWKGNGLRWSDYTAYGYDSRDLPNRDTKDFVDEFSNCPLLEEDDWNVE